MKEETDLDFTTGEAAPLLKEEWIKSWLVQDDDDYIVFNKPGGIICHPSKNGPWSSLVGASREVFHLPRVHLAHRLDRETSGLVILARHRASARSIQMAFEKRQVQKAYLALLEGSLPEPVLVNQPLAKDLESPVYIKQTVRRSRSAQSAVTQFLPLWSNPQCSLVLCRPQTGRKHQIRAHAAWLGKPLKGDKIYGPDDSWYLHFIEKGWTPEIAHALELPRQALHAAILQFSDYQGQQRRFFAPLPSDLLEALSNAGCPLSAGPIHERTLQIFEESLLDSKTEPKS